MIKSYSILANNGHLADKSTVVSEGTAKSVQRMLVNAVNEGTGKRAALSGLVVGGKTGTLSAGTSARSADLDGSPFFGLFGGYVESKIMPLVAFVLIEEGHRTNDRHQKAGGGVVAAPVFHEVMKKSLEVLK